MGGVPVIASFHNPPNELEVRLKNTDFLKNMKGIILLGNNQIPFFKKGCPKVPLKVIPLGVDTDFFSPLPYDTRLPPKVLIVGSHLRDWALIRTFLKKLREKKMDVAIQFLIPKVFQEEIPDGTNITNKHPVSDEELKQLYQQASVMFYGPKDCVGSNAVVEALSCGVPIVTPDIGAIRDYVDPSNAFVHDKKDVDGMVVSSLKLLMNPEVRAKMSAAARNRAFVLDWKNIRNQHLDFYRELGFCSSSRK